jgi:hypothetical protein
MNQARSRRGFSRRTESRTCHAIVVAIRSSYWASKWVELMEALGSVDS